MIDASSFGPPPGFALMGVFIFVVFVIVAVSVLVKIGRGLSDWSYNNSQPVLSRKATVVSKRLEVTGHGNHGSTTYYATFELEDGDRRELKLSGSEYGLLADGDTGSLSFQGSRFVGFDRAIAEEPAEESRPSGPPLVCAYCGAQNPPTSHKCAGCGSAKLSPTSEITEA